MSTRIEHGYRYRNPDGGAPDLFRLARDFRDALGPVNQRLYTEMLARLVGAHIDLSRLAEPALREELSDTLPAPLPVASAVTDLGAHAVGGAVRPLAAAARLIDAHQRAAASTMRRDPLFDLTASITILPGPAEPQDQPQDQHQGERGAEFVYVLLHAEQGPYRNAMADIAGLEAYGYQNASDIRPDGVSLEQWREREQVWRRVLPIGRRPDPADYVSVELSHWSAGPFVTEVADDVLALLADTDRRAAEIANACVNVVDVDALPNIYLRAAEDIRAERIQVRDALVPRLHPIAAADLMTPIPEPVPEPPLEESTGGSSAEALGEAVEAG